MFCVGGSERLLQGGFLRKEGEVASSEPIT